MQPLQPSPACGVLVAKLEGMGFCGAAATAAVAMLGADATEATVVDYLTSEGAATLSDTTTPAPPTTMLQTRPDAAETQVCSMHSERAWVEGWAMDLHTAWIARAMRAVSHLSSAAHVNRV